ncbi:hypothetical protein DK26_06615 [Bosea sp. WAO]|uniref:ABC transporter ATP-binding protein n=1 Tax=Bosea sp. WAO TaxID=406341 RepID=UPI0007499A6C|nr:ABC transporter ATP-binding protein [Bosea sp. WAO]KUL96467.1 hypothetical protein DK26_06615 [Bosea sp. WAO]
MSIDLLTVRNVVAGYGRIRVLDDVSLDLRQGELLAVLGANGAGKTTLLRCISRMMDVASGDILLEGRSLKGVAAPELVRLGLCHCPEGRRLFPDLPVRVNLELGGFIHTADANAAMMAKVHALFPKLAERAGQRAGTLSGGEQQMVAIGRALMGRPKVLILDEPSVGIAHGLKVQIFEAVRKIADEGISVLIVEQDAEALIELADRLYVMEQGRIVAEGPPRMIRDNGSLKAAYLGM